MGKIHKNENKENMNLTEKINNNENINKKEFIIRVINNNINLNRSKTKTLIMKRK